MKWCILRYAENVSGCLSQNIAYISWKSVLEGWSNATFCISLSANTAAIIPCQSLLAPIHINFKVNLFPLPSSMLQKLSIVCHTTHWRDPFKGMGFLNRWWNTFVIRVETHLLKHSYLVQQCCGCGACMTEQIC